MLVMEVAASTPKLAAVPRLTVAATAVTVKVVDAFLTPWVAVILLTPAAMAVALPLGRIVATLVKLDDQTTALVMSAVEASE